MPGHLELFCITKAVLSSHFLTKTILEVKDKTVTAKYSSRWNKPLNASVDNRNIPTCVCVYKAS